MKTRTRIWWAVASAVVLLANAAGASERLTVISAGTGDPVLMVPGLSGCAHGYRKLVQALVAEGFRAVVVEPLGVGASPRPDGADYTLTAQADRLAALIDSLGNPTIVVANGISGSMALRLAYRRPDLVRGVVCIEAGAAETAAGPGLASAMAKAKLVARLGGRLLLRDRLGEGLRAASGDPSWLDEVTLRRYAAGPLTDVSATARAFAAMASAREPESLQANLPRIRCPVSLLLGRAPHEGALTGEQIGILRSGLRDLAVVEVPGAGHFIHEERPELVLAEIRRLLQPAASAQAALPAAAVPSLVLNDVSGR